MNRMECEHTNNPRDIQANLEYFRDYLQKRGADLLAAVDEENAPVLSDPLLRRAAGAD